MVNLAVNARDAMPNGGEIQIETECITLKEPLERDRVSVPVGDYVCLRVIDSGTGIPADKLQKVFEPFYSTKQPGDGGGLGLAISSGIVNDLGGRLTARNGQAGGAVFEMQLPALDDGADADKTKMTAAQ